MCSSKRRAKGRSDKRPLTIDMCFRDIKGQRWETQGSEAQETFSNTSRPAAKLNHPSLLANSRHQD
jgi:hypothetical protein